MLCTRCAGETKVRGPSGYDVVDCPKCRGGKLAEDELPTLRPPPKPPDDRPTPKVDPIPCPQCLEGTAKKKTYKSPHTGEEWLLPCETCKGALHVHPAVALEFSRRK